MEKNNI